MGATRNTGYLENLIQYDASDNVAIATSVNPSYKVTLGGNLLGTSATFSGIVEVGNTVGSAINSASGLGNLVVGNGGASSQGITIYTGASTYGGLNFADATTGGGAYAGYIKFDHSNNSMGFFIGNVSRLSLASTGAATFSSSVSAGGYITGQGTNPGGLGGSRFVIDHFNGNMRIFSYGDNTSTNGGFTFNSQRSDGTNSINFLSFATSGAATFSSTIDAGGDITVSKSGDSGINVNSTTTNGTAVTRYKTTAAGNLWATGINITNSDSRWEVYNFTLGASPFRLSNSTGAATFSSSVQLSTLVSAPSYGSGSTGLNIGYMNFQNVIGIQACYANNIYYDGANWKSISSTVPWAAAVRLQAGNIDFHSASVTSSGQTMSNWDTTDLKMRITSGGQLLIGKTNNSTRLTGPTVEAQGTIYSGGNQGGFFFEDRTNATYWYGWYSTGNTNVFFYNGNSGVNIASINPSTGAYVALSDINKKKDFELSTIGLDAVMNLKPTLYRMKVEDENTEKQLGFIAQEVKKFIPQAYVESDDFIGLQYTPVIAALVKAIQEQQAQIEELKSKLS